MKAGECLLERLYRVDFGGDRGFRAAWRGNYAPPNEFVHGEWHRVASLPRASEQGLDVTVDEMRMPARFYRMNLLVRHGADGKRRGGYSISTGSGQEELVVRLAAAARDGLLDVDDNWEGLP